MSKKTKLFLVAIILTAALLRLFALSQMPPHLNWDEVSHGYNAYSILKTGKDEWGQSFPITSFRAFGDYKLPLYIYLTVPFTIFGPSELSVRLVSALSGVGAVMVTFFLIKKLFGNNRLALLSSLLLAISPWHLLVSRAAFEANLSLFLVVSGVWLFLVGLEKAKFLPISFLLFGLSLYSYNSAKVFVPLLVVVLLFSYKKDLAKNLKFLVLSICFLVILFIPHLILLPTPEGQARFFWTTILDQGAINQINENRTSSKLPKPFPKVIHNKPLYFVSHFAPNWLSHYSPQFLFFKGGSHYQYSVPSKGIAYILELPFFLIGLFAFVLLRRKNSNLVMLWFLFGPTVAALTRDSPSVLRSIFMLPSLQVVTAYGVLEVEKQIVKYNKKFQSFFIPTIVIFLMISATFFLIDYFGQYRKDYSFAWQYGYKDVAKYIENNYDSYDRIIITKKYGEPHEFLLFYLRWDPKKYRNDPSLVRYYRSNWYWVDRFDKFYFVNDWEIKDKGPEIAKDGRNLLITSPGNFPQNAKIIDTIFFLNQDKAFELFTI